ncbi:electron transporter SenC, partial [Pseudomonas sp. 2995-1]
MIKDKRTLLSTIVVFIFGIALFYIGTDGFRAYTAETARIYQLVETQPQFPEVTLEDSRADTYSISKFQGKYIIITFMYT